MRFGGLIFDMGDVLFDASLWRRWLTARLRGSGVDITYDRLVDKWEALLVDVYKGRSEYWKQFGVLLTSLGLTESQADELAAAARARGRQVRSERRLFDGVEATLAKLKEAGVKMAVLSDTQSGQDRIREILRSLRIERYFDAVVTSADTGCVKPEKAAYEAAAHALGLDLSRCAFVGHDVDELQGARRAGLFAVAYNCDPKAPADLHVGHFSQLLSVVAGED